MFDPATLSAMTPPPVPSGLTTSVLTNMLATAIAPVTLISGITFLTSVMANRYGRCIDRIRKLLQEVPNLASPSKKRDDVITQINILYARVRALRNTMTMAAISIFLIVLTVCGSFSNMLLHFPSATIIAAIFLSALLLLVIAVTGFIRDILISLHAVKIEIKSGLDADIATRPAGEVTFNPQS